MTADEAPPKLRAGRVRSLLASNHFSAVTSLPPDVALAAIAARAERSFAPVTVQHDGQFRVTILRRTSRPLQVRMSGSPKTFEIAEAAGAAIPSGSGSVVWGRISLRGWHALSALAMVPVCGLGLVLTIAMTYAVVTGDLTIGGAMGGFGVAAVFLSVVPTKLLPLAHAMGEAQMIVEQSIGADLRRPLPHPPA